jgi:hypothetical protein
MAEIGCEFLAIRPLEYRLTRVGGVIGCGSYVLWTDADNLQLVQKYYPQFLQTYQDLPQEVYRADMVCLLPSRSVPQHICD